MSTQASPVQKPLFSFALRCQKCQRLLREDLGPTCAKCVARQEAIRLKRIEEEKLDDARWDAYWAREVDPLYYSRPRSAYRNTLSPVGFVQGCGYTRGRGQS